jgi:hypothetical protein
MKISIFPKYWKDLIFTPACFYGILALSLLPAVYLFWYNKEKAGAISTLSVKIESLHKKSLLNKMKAEKEEKILNKMKGADPYYIDKYVESLHFLDAEIKKWQKLSLDEDIRPNIEQRLAFLNSNKNKLSFAEGLIQSQGKFREIEEKQKHPVEINEEDLKKILCVLEGISISPNYAPEKHPQIVIKQFELTKKSHAEIKEKVFLLSMQLLKRELNNEALP